MDGARTRGHPAALAAVGSMIRGGAPHAVLLVGAAGVGKTTLASDLAAGLLCSAPDVAARPCGVCRACRLVAHGSHPDLHRLGPDGPGRQVVIGGPGAKVRGVRDLITELALLPVEGGARVAIVESADRMNEDAQSALLKTLEEPPDGVTIVLCADAEEPLLPTIRSRTARLRLGPVGVRDIETILAEHGAADAPLAARLARISGGRPGVALGWASQPDALRARDELARTLLDLLAARAADRLLTIRTTAAGLAASGALIATSTDASPGALPAGRRRTAATEAATPATPNGGDDASGPTDPEADDAGAVARVPAAERRRVADAVVGVWSDVIRDAMLSQRGLTRSVRDVGLLEDLETAAAATDQRSLVDFLDRLGRAAVLLAANVSPELVLDDLALAAPSTRRAAA
jgi:DNA polymerase-3 subunit delta'